MFKINRKNTFWVENYVETQLKAYVRYFLFFIYLFHFIYSPNDSPSKTEK